MCTGEPLNLSVLSGVTGRQQAERGGRCPKPGNYSKFLADL